MILLVMLQLASFVYLVPDENGCYSTMQVAEVENMAAIDTPSALPRIQNRWLRVMEIVDVPRKAENENMRKQSMKEN